MNDQQRLILTPHIAIAALYVIASVIVLQVIYRMVHADISELTQALVTSCHVTISR